MKNRDTLLLYSLNYSPELTGIGKYNGEMVKWFADKDDSMKVICAAPYYPEWQCHSDYSNKVYQTEQSGNISVTRCPHYIPKSPTTIKRLMHLISFALTSAVPLFFSCWRKPRVLMVVQPTLFCTPLALLFCKLFGIKSLLHVQDFELDAMFGLSMSKSNGQGRLARLAFRVERFILRSFDAVSTISHSMMARAQSKGVDPERILFFPNWSDTHFVHPGIDGAPLRQEWGVADDEKLVLYAGNIGAKQGLELLLDAAAAMAHNRKIKFFIVGSGAHKEVLENQSRSRGLDNVYFKPLLPWESVPTMLAAADVHLVIQRKGAADAVLPSKLTNILSAGGHAVVTAEPHTELGRIAAKHPGIFSCVDPENLDGFLHGLESELTAASRNGVNPIARRYAETNLNQDAILTRFRSDLELLVGGSIRTTSENG